MEITALIDDWDIFVIGLWGLSFLLHFDETGEEEVILQGHVLFQVLEECVELLVHQAIGCTAIGRSREVLGNLGNAVPCLARGVVLEHHLAYWVGDAAAMERRGLAALLMCLVELIELGEEHLLLFDEMGVELLKRLGYQPAHLVQLGMAAAMHALHLKHQLQQLVVMQMEVTMVVLEYIIGEQVEWPGSELGCAALGVSGLQASNHVAGVESLLLARLLQRVETMAAIVDAKMLKNFCSVEVIGNQCTDRSVGINVDVHNQ